MGFDIYQRDGASIHATVAFFYLVKKGESCSVFTSTFLSTVGWIILDLKGKLSSFCPNQPGGQFLAVQGVGCDFLVRQVGHLRDELLARLHLALVALSLFLRSHDHPLRHPGLMVAQADQAHRVPDELAIHGQARRQGSGVLEQPGSQGLGKHIDIQLAQEVVEGIVRGMLVVLASGRESGKTQHFAMVHLHALGKAGNLDHVAIAAQNGHGDNRKHRAYRVDAIVTPGIFEAEKDLIQGIRFAWL